MSMKKHSILAALVVFLCLFFFDSAVVAQSAAPSISANYGLSVDNNKGVDLGIRISSGSTSDFQVGVNASHGVLKVTSVTGLSSITGNITKSVTVDGKIRDINAALSTMMFIPDPGYYGADVISVIAFDLGDSQTSSIQVPIMINDSSHIVVPGAISGLSNSDLDIKGISLSYPSMSSGSMPVTLYASHGIIDIPGAAGLAHIWNNGTSKVTLLGSYDNINTALAGLKYHSEPQYAGNDLLIVSTNDMGGSEYPGQDAVTATVVINILDRPRVMVPVKQLQWTPDNSIDGGGLTISGTYIKYDSSGYNTLRVTLAAGHGSITLNTASNQVSMVGNGTGSITVTGDVSSVNSVLSYMSYRFNTNYSGSDTIGITVMDLASSASGSSYIDINKASVNDILLVSSPLELAASNGVVSKIQGFFITSLNPVNDNMEAVISASHGVVSLLSVNGLEYVSGNGTGKMTLAGSLTIINSVAVTLTYTPTQGYKGSDSVTMDVTDLNTYKTASGSALINVDGAADSFTESSVQLIGSNIDIKPALDSGSGTAKASLSLEDIAGAASNVLQDSSGNRYVTITVALIAGVNSYKVSLPADVLMDPSVTIKLKISTSFCSVIIPSNLFCGMNPVGKEFAISITNVDPAGFPGDLKSAIGSRPVIRLDATLNGLKTTWGGQSDPVSVSIPYQASARERINPEHIAVWCLNDSGSVYPVTNGRYDALTGQVNFNVTHFSKYAITYINKTFTDLSKYEWAKKQIEVMASRGIISGTSASTFNPAANITRGDFVKLLLTTLELSAEPTDNFSDVSKTAYYYNMVGVARKLGIATAYNDGSFKPAAYITRQDMMIMTAKALQIARPGMPYGSYSDLSGFSDRDEISLSARDYVGTLVKNGIITGANGKLSPAKYMSRAEAAVILYKLLQ